jgi:hypothetical protein
MAHFLVDFRLASFFDSSSRWNRGEIEKEDTTLQLFSLPLFLRAEIRNRWLTIEKKRG